MPTTAPNLSHNWPGDTASVHSLYSSLHLQRVYRWTKSSEGSEGAAHQERDNLDQQLKLKKGSHNLPTEAEPKVSFIQRFPL